MKILGAATRWLFILCLPLLLLTIGLGWAINSLWLYNYGFEKYAVSQSTGLAETELDKAARGLISYFNSGEEFINVTVVKNNQPFQLFNQREIVHLKDVKGLIRLDYGVLLGTLIYVAGYSAFSLYLKKRNRRELARGVVAGSGLTLALMLALGLGMLLNFDQLFLQFHLLSFSNDFWQLDPTRDYLIMLFPGGFWYDATLFAVLAIAGMAVVLGGVSAGLLLATRKRPAA
ncbi:MAG: TIGR01906 family membrane protein [Chloroflexi bacterium]|nr:TIGR01906 family membrane protein [Chloroflexota bacterium]